MELVRYEEWRYMWCRVVDFMIRARDKREQPSESISGKVNETVKIDNLDGKYFTACWWYIPANIHL